MQVQSISLYNCLTHLNSKSFYDAYSTISITVFFFPFMSQIREAIHSYIAVNKAIALARNFAIEMHIEIMGYSHSTKGSVVIAVIVEGSSFSIQFKDSTNLSLAIKKVVRVEMISLAMDTYC